MSASRPFATRLSHVPQLTRVATDVRERMAAVAAVLPFRVSAHVLESLIDWDRVPDDPIFQLTFPQPGMLAPEDLRAMLDAQRSNDSARVEQTAAEIRRRLNPQPAAQLTANVPKVDGEPLRGAQHKYRETVLLFPSPGQTCHAYCSYCFRWAQFVGVPEWKLQSREPDQLARYVRAHPEVQSVLFTGGDPLVMRTDVLRRYVAPLLDIEHVRTVRIGTKAVVYQPQRFVEGEDADALLRLFEEVRARGKQLALMAHYSHPQELAPPVARDALARIRSAGAVVRTQAPIIAHVNDDADVWAELWQTQVRLGAVPYYQFLARDTGARGYFEVPLARALEIYQGAVRQCCGLGRTARGPVMSCRPGKVRIVGVSEVAGERVFVLEMLQARNPAWVGRPFFARFDAEACWIDQLTPAFGDEAWFWQR